MRHFHYTFQGYDRKQGADLVNTTQVTVIGFELVAALETAKELIPKPHWRCATIQECYGEHDGIKQLVEAIKQTE